VKIFLAGTKEIWKDKNFVDVGLKYKPSILESFYTLRNSKEWYGENKILFGDFLLDSGAFTFMSGTAKESNWDQYARDYANYIKTNGVENYFELDLDSLMSLDKVEGLRKLIEDITGVASIPVWHKSRGLDYWFKMCEDYKYIAIGGIVSKEIKRSQFDVFHKLISIADKNKTKVHGLGFTNLVGIKKYKFYSVDSITWLNGRYGCLFHFNGSSMLAPVKCGDGKPLNKYKTNLHNFTEWVKFSKFMERHF